MAVVRHPVNEFCRSDAVYEAALARGETLEQNLRAQPGAMAGGSADRHYVYNLVESIVLDNVRLGFRDRLSMYVFAFGTFYGGEGRDYRLNSHVHRVYNDWRNDRLSVPPLQRPLNRKETFIRGIWNRPDPVEGVRAFRTPAEHLHAPGNWMTRQFA